MGKKKKKEVKKDVVVKHKKKKKNEKLPKVREKSFRNWKNRLIERFKPKNLVMVEMLHYNGSISHLIITGNTHKFKYGGREYIIDEERKLWNNCTKMFMWRYHEGFSLPLSIDINVSELNDAVDKNEKLSEISTSFNPYVLKDVLKFEYAKGVIQGAEVSETVRRILIITAIVLCVSILHFGLNAYLSGWLG